MEATEAIKGYLSDRLNKMVVDYDTEWYSLCETCEYSAGSITVIFDDGTTDTFEERFGIFLEDILHYVNDDLEKGRTQSTWIAELDSLVPDPEENVA